MAATIIKQERFKLLLELDEQKTTELLVFLMEYGTGDVCSIIEDIMEAFDNAGIDVTFSS